MKHLLLAFAMGATAIGAATAGDIGTVSYPSFSWQTVPVAGDFESPKAFTEEEARFIGSHFAFVSLEKGQGRASLPAHDNYTEDGFIAATAALKRANPDIKVLFYWNSAIFYALYRATVAVGAKWCALDSAGGCERDVLDRTHFNRSIPQFRQWWVTTAASLVNTARADGVFIDAVGDRTDPDLQEMFERLAAELHPVHRDLILFNATHGDSPSTADYEGLSAGLMIEHIDIFGGRKPEQLRADLLAALDAGRRGKIVLFKGWPKFNWLDEETKHTPYPELVARARQDIEFPLACFLAVAHRYSYFQYSWGYVYDEGNLLLDDERKSVDAAWYSELLRPLGPPLHEPDIDGDVFKRSYEHADVMVNIRSHVADIKWH